MADSPVVEVTPRPGPPAARPTDRVLDPVSLVIFGASGDLTGRKLLPSLFRLFRTNGLPERFQLIGAARSEMDDAAFRNRAAQSLAAADPEADRPLIEEFCSRIHYQPVIYDDHQSCLELAGRLRRVDEEGQTQGNRLYYLAVPPTLYPVLASSLGRAGLTAEGENGNGWARLVVEKPFGRDLDSALDLDRILHQHLAEHQIFRIDHYLAKETVQNVLMFRFANAIFEPIWNRRFIDYVVITAAEAVGVEHRAGYYEQAGVLRDMFQNHMMQLLALSAMEPPARWEADLVRDEKVKLFRALRPFPQDDLANHLVLGQYGPGAVAGERAASYLDEPGVAPESITPTFAMLKTYIDNWRWQGVPFYLTSGKRLRRKQTQIDIQFREVPHSMFRSVLDRDITANRLTMAIQPEEKIKLTFQTKNPGAGVALRPVTMEVNYYQDYRGQTLDAYERALLDVMLGDHILFWRQDGVEACWSFLTPILYECERQCERAARPHPYWAGTWGPEQTAGLMDLGGILD